MNSLMMNHHGLVMENKAAEHKHLIKRMEEKESQMTTMMMMMMMKSFIKQYVFKM